VKWTSRAFSYFRNPDLSSLSFLIACRFGFVCFFDKAGNGVPLLRFSPGKGQLAICSFFDCFTLLPFPCSPGSSFSLILTEDERFPRIRPPLSPVEVRTSYFFSLLTQHLTKHPSHFARAVIRQPFSPLLYVFLRT